MTKEERIQKLRNMNIVTEDQICQLDQMGFFTAPASRKYHGAYEGGLFDHSLEVANVLVRLTEDLALTWGNFYSPRVIGMFHDLCKCDQYIPIIDPTDKSVTYAHNDKSVLKGHGEKSIMLLSRFMTLTEEEILCIRYHMGAYNVDEWTQYDLAIRKCPNVLFTHTADMIASKISGV